MDKQQIKNNIDVTKKRVEKQRKSPGVYTSETDQTYTGGINKGDQLFRTGTDSPREEMISDKIIVNKEPNVTT